MNAFANLSHIHPNAMFVFGVFLLLGVFGGMIATRFKWIPTITAFMLFGFVIGPHGLGLINEAVLHESSILTEIAIGLILYKLGNMLHPREMIHSKRLLITTLVETALTFILVAGILVGAGYDVVMSVLVGAIAVSSSPAVLVHVSEELRAKGPVTEHAKSLVAMNNLISFLIFSLALPFALFRQEDISLTTVLFFPFYRMAGSVVIGVAVGWLAIQITKKLQKHDEHYRFVIIIGAMMLTLGLCSMLDMSVLMAPLVLGMATRWFESSKFNLSRVDLGQGADLFYIILFVMAGAELNPALVLGAGLIPVLLVLVRILAKVSGVFVAARYNSFEGVQVKAISLLLLPMAGMAIGLVSTTSNLAPDMGGHIATIVFSMVVVFETIGPFAASYAFRLCGEAGADEDEEESEAEANKTKAAAKKPA